MQRNEKFSIEMRSRYVFANGKPIADNRRIKWVGERSETDFQNYFQDKKSDDFSKEWLKGFKPLVISMDKHLYLSFDENYRFIPVKIEDGKQTVCNSLSESDEAIFNYLCFLEVNRFEFAYEEYNGYNCAKKPLFIFNFAEYLDESADVVRLLKKATDLDCQIFLFTGGFEIERLKDKEEVQILK